MKDNPLIIAGSGRSGTTWILDVIAESNNLRTVFEPLQPYGVPEAQSYGYRYLRENSYEPELKSFLIKVFNGELNNIWPNTRLLPYKLRPRISHISSWEYNYSLMAKHKRLLIRYFQYIKKKSSRLIFKFIRANLMLDWLEANFNAIVIFIVRHPGAVAVSKISAAKTCPTWDFYGKEEQKVLYQYKNDKLLKEDYLYKYYEIFSENLTPVEGYTLLWCIENILPIYRQQKKKKYVFFYEDIVSNPLREFCRIFEIFGLKGKPEISVITSPSQQASREMKTNPVIGNQLTRWMSGLSQKQFNEIDKILKFFNVTNYNAYEPFPVNRNLDFIL